jgi:glycosyltransferase involved in cell wall biosynthesis
MREYILDAIDSVQNQTYRNIEIIVVDDGSEDRVRETLYSEKKQNLIVIEQNNLGLAAARNTGLIRSQGEFIQFLDADDTISPEKIESKLIFLMQTQNIAL